MHHIDGLKLVNDPLGHETGDDLIRDAAVQRESLRDTDVLARLGGDEFVAFALDDAHPRAILARLRGNLHAFNLMQERPYNLSISAGAVPSDPDSDAPLLDYVQRADQKMYAHMRRALHQATRRRCRRWLTIRDADRTCPRAPPASLRRSAHFVLSGARQPLQKGVSW